MIVVVVVIKRAELLVFTGIGSWRGGGDSAEAAPLGAVAARLDSDMHRHAGQSTRQPARSGD